MQSSTARRAAAAVGILASVVGAAVSLTNSRELGVVIAVVGVVVLLGALLWVRLSVAIVRTAAAQDVPAFETSLRTLLGLDDVDDRQILSGLQHVHSELTHDLALFERAKATGRYWGQTESVWVGEWNKAKHVVASDGSLVPLFRTLDAAYDEIHRVLGVVASGQSALSPSPTAPPPVRPEHDLDRAIGLMREAQTQVAAAVDRLAGTP